MKNFESLFIAWMAVWAVFIVYQTSIGRRLARLREELDRLKSQLPGR
ncbi:MAG: CcmD family protein [Candidatus Acidiferrales bacterium]